MKSITTLGIETSCDETSAALFDNQRGIIAHTTFSQIALHEASGGVIPEVASRSQLEKITPIIKKTFEQASLTLADIDVVAVTHKPGLPGSLLVGVCFAKMLAWAKNKKLIGINHLEGHIFSACIEHTVPFPHLCMTASGGHTALYLVHDFGKYELLAQTQDDAAGEAFDKIAKLLNLPYPGGPIIEKLAREMNFQDFFHYPRSSKGMRDFSFSGLKTAVLYDLVAKQAYDMKTKQFLKESDSLLKQQVASSLLVCIADIFEQKIAKALVDHPSLKALTFVGGVACNKYIANRLKIFCDERSLQFFKPSPQYCTDNGAMIAFVGNYKAHQGLFSDWDLDI